MSISTVTSEALQLKLRQLLPSQQGFGTDLSASDTIIPIIDLTAAAEGSDVPEFLQRALAFGSQTVFSAVNATDVIVNTAGFYQITGTSTVFSVSGGMTNKILFNDGSTDKTIYTQTGISGNGTSTDPVIFEFVVFLRSGDSVSAVSSSSFATISGSVRQLADVNGALIQPSGFTPQ
tara:strand:- start:30 stop:560 length:531 start_codon:yes stop_codon:yes gene_type:complete